MAKKPTSNDTNTDSTTPAKRQRGKQSYFSRLFPFIGELKAYADEKYTAARFDKDTSDAELRKRDDLRNVLADFPLKG
jgi:hypothetical protein